VDQSPAGSYLGNGKQYIPYPKKDGFATAKRNCFQTQTSP